MLHFQAKALRAKKLYRMPKPNGGVPHPEFMTGDPKIYISDESEEWHAYAMAEGAKALCLFEI